jgi:hypothetical protein
LDLYQSVSSHFSPALNGLSAHGRIRLRVPRPSEFHTTPD